MSHTSAVFLMILTSFLWSTAGVVTRHLDAAGGFEITFWRSAVTAAALAVFLSFIGGRRFWIDLARPTKRAWVSGVCWSIMFTAFMIALTMTSVANVLIIMSLGPLFTAVAARIFLNNRLNPVTWMAIVAAGLGIAWMFGHDADSAFSLQGSLVALCIPTGAAVNFTLLQYVGMKQQSVGGSVTASPFEMQHALLIGAIVSATATLPLAWPLQASSHDIGLLAILGITQLATPCLLVIYISKVLSAPEITLFSLLEIVFGVTWAWLWAGESLSYNTVMGGILVLGALIVNVLATNALHSRNMRRI